MTGPVPPHSFEAESAVVGSLLLNPSSAIADIIPTGLEPADFYTIHLRQTYQAIIDMATDGVGVDLITVKDELTKRKILTEQFTIEKLASLLESVPTASNAGQYAKIVKRKAIERHVLRLSQEISTKASHGTELNGELDELALLGHSLAAGAPKAKWTNRFHTELTNSTFLEDHMDQEVPYLVKPIAIAGSLTQIQGDPKGGKSSFALYVANCIANNIWPNPDFISSTRAMKVLYLTWEDPKIMIAKRLSMYNVGMGLPRKQLSPNLMFLFSPEIFIDEEESEKMMKEMIRDTGAEIIFIDTLSQIHKVDENVASEMKVPMARLQRVATEMNCAILYIHHTVKTQKDVAIQAKGRGSGSIAASWHVLIDWGRREEGSHVNPIEIQSKYLHEWLNWDIAYIPMMSEETKTLNGIRWEILDKREKSKEKQESVSARRRRLMVETVTRLTLSKEWTTAEEVANTANLGMDERGTRRMLSGMCEEGKLLSTIGPRKTSLFKPMPIASSPASS